MKQFTPSQLVNVIVLVLMAALVVAVNVALSHHIPVNPAVVSLAGLAATAVAGTCRSYMQRFAGLLPDDVPGLLRLFGPYLGRLISQAGATTQVPSPAGLGLGLPAPIPPYNAAQIASAVDQAPPVAEDIHKTLQQNRDELMAAVASLSERVGRLSPNVPATVVLGSLPAAAPATPVVPQPAISQEDLAALFPAVQKVAALFPKPADTAAPTDAGAAAEPVYPEGEGA